MSETPDWSSVADSARVTERVAVYDAPSFTVTVPEGAVVSLASTVCVADVLDDVIVAPNDVVPAFAEIV